MREISDGDPVLVKLPALWIWSCSPTTPIDSAWAATLGQAENAVSCCYQGPVVKGTGNFFRAKGGNIFQPEILRQTHMSWSKWSSVPLKWTYKLIQITNESYVHHCLQLILLHKFSLQSHQTWQQSGKIAIYCNTMWYSYFSNQFAPAFLGRWGFLGLNLQVCSA